MFTFNNKIFPLKGAPNSRYFSYLSALVLLCAACLLFFCGQLPGTTLILIVAFSLILAIYQYAILSKKYIKALTAWWGLVFLGLGIGLYQPNGFSYPTIFEGIILHEGGAPFTLRLNIGKSIAGYTIIAFMCPLIIQHQPLPLRIQHKILITLLLPFVIILIAYCLLELAFYFKELRLIFIFGTINLFTTCIAEEAFMRLVLQNELIRLISKYTKFTSLRELIPLILSSLLFIATHYTPSINMLIVFGLAGFLYGAIYSLTKNIFYSIALHFFVNLLHFSFLTYPLIS